MPVRLTAAQIGKITQWEKVYNRFMSRYLNLEKDVAKFNGVTRDLFKDRVVRRIKDQLDPETLAARLKELDGHKIFNNNGKLTNDEPKMQEAIESSRKLQLQMQKQISKFESNGHAKPGEIQYLKDFSKTLNEAINKISDLGRIECSTAVPKP